jgi:hypothetical protein
MSNRDTMRSGKQRPYLGVQDVEAGLMAKPDGSRCTGAPVIPCRSSVGRWQDSDVDVLVVLVIKQRREGVSEVRVTEKRKKVQKKIQERVEGYRIPAMLSGRDGGAMLSIRAAWRQVC